MDALLERCEQLAGQLRSLRYSEPTGLGGADEASEGRQMRTLVTLRDDLTASLLRADPTTSTSAPSHLRRLLRAMRTAADLTPDFAVSIEGEQLSPLQFCVATGNNACCAALLAEGADPDFVPESATIAMTPLAMAVGGMHALAMVPVLLRAGSNPFTLPQGADPATNALAAAVQGGNARAVETIAAFFGAKRWPVAPTPALLELGGYPAVYRLWERLKTSTMHKPQSPNGAALRARNDLLSIVIECEGSNAIGLLEDILGHFGCVDLVLQGRTLLQHAIISNNIDLAVVLIIHDAELHVVPPNALQLSPFCLAACLGRLDLLAQMLERGATAEDDPLGGTLKNLITALQFAHVELRDVDLIEDDRDNESDDTSDSASIGDDGPDSNPQHRTQRADALRVRLHTCMNELSRLKTEQSRRGREFDAEVAGTEA